MPAVHKSPQQQQPGSAVPQAHLYSGQLLAQRLDVGVCTQQAILGCRQLLLRPLDALLCHAQLALQRGSLRGAVLQAPSGGEREGGNGAGSSGRSTDSTATRHGTAGNLPATAHNTRLSATD